MKRSSGFRKAVDLPDSIHRQLNMYALAAGAAGVGLLALAQPARAKIVYTPANVRLDGVDYLDLNDDGKRDFVFVHGWGSNYSFLSVCKSLSHEAACYGTSINAVRVNGRYAAALRGGEIIQANDRFGIVSHFVRMGSWSHEIRAAAAAPNWYGPWMNGGKGVKNRYLGLRFKIAGESDITGKIHFGWARITVTTTDKSFTATLTGYAYETIAGKAITAGQTKGPDDNNDEAPDASLTEPTDTPATLGMLALGAAEPAIWRREEAADPKSQTK